MQRIQLGDGYEALIDDCDALLVAGFNWVPLVTRSRSKTVYVHAWQGRQHFYMHRLIVGAAPDERVDHDNRDGLDNQRRNLRIATPSQNGANRVADRRKLGKTSRYKGVFWDKARGRWAAAIHVNGKTRALGRFDSEEVAAAAYDRAAVDAWGRFALTNF